MAQPAQKLTPRDKSRRRQRALFSIFGYIVVAIGLSWFFESQATTTILFVRHAEAELANGDEDPGLSSAGLVRAEALADFVQDIDVIAGVDAIYASEFKRTQETAAAVARRLELEVAIADPYEVEDFMASVLRAHKGDIVLVVSHADAIAPLIEELHGSKNVPDMAPDDYDEFYIVTIPWFGKVKTLRLHYDVNAGSAATSRRMSAPL
jgi:2,3-bisphosphoglycerate-dependent phosphoglycerate mutase